MKQLIHVDSPISKKCDVCLEKVHADIIRLCHAAVNKERRIRNEYV